MLKYSLRVDKIDKRYVQTTNYFSWKPTSRTKIILWYKLLIFTHFYIKFQLTLNCQRRLYIYIFSFCTFTYVYSLNDVHSLPLVVVWTSQTFSCSLIFSALETLVYRSHDLPFCRRRRFFLIFSTCMWSNLLHVNQKHLTSSRHIFIIKSHSYTETRNKKISEMYLGEYLSSV